jgi:hypothetical protein
MAHSLPDSNDQHPSDPQPTGEELAVRLFSLVMFGVCAVILLMVAFGDW